jgi:hypothetical protein
MQARELFRPEGDCCLNAAYAIFVAPAGISSENRLPPQVLEQSAEPTKETFDAIALASTAFAFTPTASAAVVCNDEGDCWRGIRVYNDDRHWKEGERYRWRDAGYGHGYWRGGVWVTID